MRLYCFPHSGGAPGEFLRWSDDLPDVEVWGLQLPGRGRRFAEPHVTNLGELVSSLTAEAAPHPPFAFFGHSLGALVAFETARSLRARGLTQPVRIFASALPAPDIPYQKQPLKELSDDDLVASVAAQYGDTFGAVGDDPELLASSVASFRSDFGMIEAYQYAAERPLDAAITAFGGVDDDIDTAELAAWRRHSATAFDLRTFSGGHFYFRDHREQVLASVRAALGGARDESESGALS